MKHVSTWSRFLLRTNPIKANSYQKSYQKSLFSSAPRIMSTQAKIIDGKASAAIVTDAVQNAVAKLKELHSIAPGLATVIVGDNPASKVYVRMKQRMAVKLGIESIHHALPADISQEDLLNIVKKLNDDKAVHGILVQLPLPDHLDPISVINTISPEKDVDGLHPINAGRLVTGEEGMLPCTPMGCIMLLADAVDTLVGKNAVMLGRSTLVGKPLALLLLNENCTVTTVHSKTEKKEEVCRGADILIAAIGRPNEVKADWVKPGAIVIDVGVNRVELPEGKHKLVGDVAYDEVSKVASAITPVPGGVGPMTIACLMLNTLKAACKQNSVTDVNYPGLRLPHPDQE